MIHRLGVVRRWRSNPKATEGELFLDGKHECWTLEDPSRGLTSFMTTDEIKTRKVFGETAIPTGVYELELYDSPKHGPDTLQLKEVPGFEHIQIHVANKAEDLLGCIAVGNILTDVDDDWIGSSGAALQALKTKVVPWMKNGEKVYLSVREEWEFASYTA